MTYHNALDEFVGRVRQSWRLGRGLLITGKDRRIDACVRDHTKNKHAHLFFQVLQDPRSLAYCKEQDRKPAKTVIINGIEHPNPGILGGYSPFPGIVS